MKFLKFLQYKLHVKLQQMMAKMMKLGNEKKLSQYEIWNDCQAYLGKEITMTFGDLFYITTFLEMLVDVKDSNTALILKNIMTLWMLKVYRYDEMINSEYHKVI